MILFIIYYLYYSLQKVNIMNNYILIDNSYYTFYRYYALINWFKLAYPDEDQNEIHNNEIFIEKFKKIYIDKIKEIPRKLKINKQNYTIIAAFDCSRKNIWRNQYYDNYKTNRVQDENFMGSKFFEIGKKILLDENIMTIEYDKLEADDCIAILSKELINNKNSVINNIYIIANDMDYLQLCCENIKVLNLKYNYLNENKNSTKNNKCDLFCKIVLGDKSDNINGLFKRCSRDKAIEYFNNIDLFIEKIKKENLYDMYLNNKKIIDFDEIPSDLYNNFKLYLKNKNII